VSTQTTAGTVTREGTATTGVPSTLLATVQVSRVERLSPAFTRVWLASPALADLARDQGFDTRFKIVFPGPTGQLPPSGGDAQEWQAGWMAMPDDVRSPMRTYTIRDVVGTGEQTELVVDLVVHESDDPATLGPACRWALAATPGDTVVVLAPHRAGTPWGGTEFEPGSCRDLLLIGDETALPAITRILADVGPGHTGHVFVEVPTRDDVLDLDVPPGFDLTWLTRDGRAYNRQLVAAVRSHLGLPASDLSAPVPEVPSELEVEVWETPRYSSAGEDLAEQLSAARAGRDLDGTYAWIAGESWCVKLLRRALVTELDVDRSRVAFMGYWREGVSMRS
jgi:NADPH-dependent ferric siderophore reductase